MGPILGPEHGPERRVPECGPDPGFNGMITHSPVINVLKPALGPETEPRSGVADSSDHCVWRGTGSGLAGHIMISSTCDSVFT